MTGAGGGFGEGIAKRFVEEGAKVAVVDLRGAAAERVAQELGNGAVALQADVGASADVARVVRETAARLGTPGILVNNAGTTHKNKPLLEVAEDEFDRMFRVNVGGFPGGRGTDGLRPASRPAGSGAPGRPA